MDAPHLNSTTDQIRWSDSAPIDEEPFPPPPPNPADPGTGFAVLNAVAAAIGTAFVTPFVVLWGGALFFEGSEAHVGVDGLGLWFTGLILAPMMAALAFATVGSWTNVSATP